MIIKQLYNRNYVGVEQIGYGNAFRYNSRIYFLCSPSKDVPLKDGDNMFAMDTGGQIQKVPRTAIVEELPTVLVEYNTWEEAIAQMDQTGT